MSGETVCEKAWNSIRPLGGAFWHELSDRERALAIACYDAGTTRLSVAVEALLRIEKWHGEFPDTGKFWDEKNTEPMSYAACFGSNGERDFMRTLARTTITRISELTDD